MVVVGRGRGLLAGKWSRGLLGVLIRDLGVLVVLRGSVRIVHLMVGVVLGVVGLGGGGACSRVMVLVVAWSVDTWILVGRC